MFRFLLILPFILLQGLTSLAFAAAGGDALVTSLSGTVTRLTDSGPQPLEAFVKLKEGDRLSLGDQARIQLVYFANGRQEQWSGKGTLELSTTEGKGNGLGEPQIKTLPAVLVKQIAKTPALDSQGRAGAVRLRAIPTPEALAKLDKEYRLLRETSPADDLNPELFLLSGLLEMRQVERIEQVLGELKQSQPYNMEVKVLASLYQKTLKNLRESGK